MFLQKQNYNMKGKPQGSTLLFIFLSDTTELKSTITCPKCGHKKEEEMPTDACLYFYECEKCNVVLNPNKGDCCVFCSLGTVPWPPIQENKNCGDTSCC
jgi:rubredoxin